MILLTNIFAQYYQPDFVEVHWQIDSTLESLSNYVLNVYQSDTSANDLSQYSLLASGIDLENVDYYYDYSVSGLTNKFDEYYYILQVSGIGTSQVKNYPPVYVDVTPDQAAKEIIRRRNLVFDRKSGQDYLFYKRKTHGQFCTANYDATLQRTTSSHCPVCYDTGYEGGFFKAIKMRGQLNEGPTRMQITVFGDFQDQDSIFYTKGFPALTQKDIIVDKLGRRWVAITVRSFNKALFTIGQQVQVRQVERGDIVAQLPIDFS